MTTDNLRRAGTGKSALGLLLVVVGVIAVAVAACYVLSMPGMMDSVINILVTVLLALCAIAVLIYVIMAVLALPMYAYKGEVYQENVDYTLDEIKTVNGKEESPEGPESK